MNLRGLLLFQNLVDDFQGRSGGGSLLSDPFEAGLSGLGFFLWVHGELANELLCLLLLLRFECRSMREEFGTAFPEVLIGRSNDQGKPGGNGLDGVLPAVVRRQGLSQEGNVSGPDELWQFTGCVGQVDDRTGICPPRLAALGKGQSGRRYELAYFLTSFGMTGNEEEAGVEILFSQFLD